MTPSDSHATTDYWVVVPAAGAGTRMGANTPKQYLPIDGKPLIAHTLENILSWPGLKGVVVSLSADDAVFVTLECAQDDKVQTVIGGAERADSVLAALEYLSQHQSPASPVLVHDAARPLVSTEDIDKLLAAAPMALLAQPASDTVKLAGEENSVRKTLPREQIWLAQTPQKAPLGTLLQALQRGLDENPKAITDEASALELAGHAPELVAACRSNFKITHPSDLVLAEALLRHRSDGASSGNKL
ncbi:2-C-methyl-D-erythritol 4-phosphate cytidylyltransferase [Microbulbifer agarilyticus]|uniref:2-C-methyl-D-erythritol 4-phosphate cytidylyltransferase n=1 Tax=Microbulbifer agarilyticus TaxID=260552 RepID=UPI001C94A7E3|nr:2-C-methyl-D-erythritol 4-phosphate cytidylyltransferase [Microbulbifer agarilyticus]MBY6211952.1 2-C-methyl-D-erythritol 4-phosphate cytidylyltransferase [Microbulbifer agarilyticus]